MLVFLLGVYVGGMFGFTFREITDGIPVKKALWTGALWPLVIPFTVWAVIKG